MGAFKTPHPNLPLNTNPFPLILNGGPPHNKNSKCVFIIRGRLFSLLDENVVDDDDDDAFDEL